MAVRTRDTYRGQTALVHALDRRRHREERSMDRAQLLHECGALPEGRRVLSADDCAEDGSADHLNLKTRKQPGIKGARLRRGRMELRDAAKKMLAVKDRCCQPRV